MRSDFLKNLLVIGGGFMGSALCQLYDTPKFHVMLFEKNKERRLILQQLEQLQHVTFIEQYEEAEAVDIIIEAVPENMELKKSVLQELDAFFATNVILCTNTSSYLISELGSKVRHKERLIGTHYFSPAHITPLVEVVPTASTSKEVVDTMMTCLREINKKPVLLKKEIEGFVANRLQAALAREAMSLVDKGIVTAAELDEIAKWSIGIRLAMTGPMEQRDINGLDTHFALSHYVYPTLENRATPFPVLERAMENNELGMKTGKGFYDWKKIDIESYQNKKARTLVEIINLTEEEHI